MCLEPAADDSSTTCWFPGLFLLNDFTVPGDSICRGDGKNPATLRNHPHAGPSNTFVGLPTVLLQPAIQNVNSNAVLRFIHKDYRRYGLFRMCEIASVGVFFRTCGTTNP